MAGTNKRKQIDRSNDDTAQVVYLTGEESNVTKLNPLCIRDKIKAKYGIVDRIYLSGESLKIYCSSVEQKTAILQSVLLDDVKIRCSEPIIGLKTNYKVDVKPKTCRGVISGVSLELDVDDIRQKTSSKMAIRLNRQDRGKKTPTSWVLRNQRAGRAS